MDNNGIRHQGVRIPENQSTEQAPVNTITNITSVEHALVEWGDESGRKHTAVIVVCGGKAWLAPNAEQWTSALKPFRQEMSDSIVNELKARKGAGAAGPAVPSKDDVEV